MNSRSLLLAFTPSLLAAIPAGAAPGHAGQEHEIVRSYRTSEKTGDFSSGSSSGSDAIVERVIAVRDSGIELEFAAPREAGEEKRLRAWQLPVRVFLPSGGSMQLLNREELETRVETWLQAAKLSRAHCGRWIFTWNAFQIECDPQSVLKMLATFDLRSVDLREGASYKEDGAAGPGMLVRKAGEAGDTTYMVTMKVDPDAVRRARAEADVVLGEITGEPVTLEAALRKRAKESISGSIEVTFNLDGAGRLWRKVKVTQMETEGPDGVTGTESRTDTIERRPLKGAALRR